ncbi:MAG: tetratricopeptide repeat protein, partial [Nitrososphaeria archaeon]
LLHENPNNADLWNKKGNIHMSLKEYEKAIECYKKALKIDSNHLGAKMNLVIAKEKLYDTVKPQQAKKNLQ